MYEQRETGYGSDLSFGRADSAGAARRGPPRFVADYELLALLTRYPAVDVLLATHGPSGTERVLYVLRPAAMQDPASVQRITGELDIARRLQHPCFPTLDPWGWTSDGRVFFAMERRGGQSLGALYAEQGRPAPERLMRVATQVVEALDEAHALGLYHGHLTPESILLDRSAVAQRDAVSLLGIGTDSVGRTFVPQELPYLSPEYVAGEALDARSDVFSFASLLGFTFGQAPLPSQPTARSVQPEPGTTAAVIAAARCPDPAARPATISALWEEFLAATDRATRPELARRMPVRLTVESVPAPIDSPNIRLGAAPPARNASSPVRESEADLISRWLAEEAELHPEVSWGTTSLGPVGRRRLATAVVTVGIVVVATAALRGAGSAEHTANDIVTTSTGSLAPSPKPETSPPVLIAAPRAGASIVLANVPAPPSAPTADSSVDAPRALVLPRQLDSLLSDPPSVDGVVPNLDLEPPPTPPRVVVRNEEFAAAAESLWRSTRKDEGMPVAWPDVGRVADARREAQRAVDVFASALGARDLAALRRAVPSMPEKQRAQWARVFHNARSIDAHLTVVDARLDGDVIAATVQSKIDIALQGSRELVRSSATSVATLVHDSSGWRLRTAP